MFNKDIVYSKLNKKALDVLIRSEALEVLMDDRFTGMKHFWSSVAIDRPKNKKRFHKNIELYAPEGDFTDEEKIEYKKRGDKEKTEISINNLIKHLKTIKD